MHWKSLARVARLRSPRPLAVVASCLLLAGPLPAGLAQTPGTEPELSIDLAEVTLSTADIDRVDRPGYTHDAASMKLLQDQVADLAEACGVVGEPGSSPVAMAIESQLADAGWQRQYVDRAGLGDPDVPGHFARIVTSAVTAYERADGAEAGFAWLQGDKGNCFARGEAVAPEPDIGDAAALTRITGPDQGVETLVLTFRHGRLVGSVALTDASGEAPEIEVVEALGQLMLERMDAAGSESGLAHVLLRLDAPTISPGAKLYGVMPGIRISGAAEEGYLRRDGRDVPQPNELAGHYVARQEAFGSAVDVYQLRHVLGAGTASTPVYRVLLTRFADAESASAWFPGVQAFTQVQGLGQVAIVGDTPSLGDESLVLAFQLDQGGTVVTGYLASVRAGTDVVMVVLLAEQAPELNTVAGLMEAQLACLAEDACPGRYPVPTSLDG